MIARSTPEDGDIVIRDEQRNGRRVFLLHTPPGPDQFVVRTQEAALAQAVAFAKRQHVRVWIADGDDTFRLVNVFELMSKRSGRGDLCAVR